MGGGRVYVDTLSIGDGANRASLTAGAQGAQLDKALDVAAAFGAAGTQVAGNLTLDATTYYGFVDATAAPRLANLPASAGLPNGRSYLVQKIDASANAVTVTPDGGDTINGAASFVLSDQFAGVILSWNTTAGEWKAVAVGASGGGGEDLAATLVLGNTTGAIGTAGLPIKGPTATAASGNNGNPLVLQGGDGDGAGLRGPIQGRNTGNTRGGAAVDLQQSASLVTQVAAADFSALMGGYDNRIDVGTRNDSAGIFAGAENAITGDYAFMSVILGGRQNTINSGVTYGSYGAAILGGRNNTIGTYGYGSVICGESNTVDGNGYFASNCFTGGQNNTTQGQAGVGGVYGSFNFGRQNVNEGDTSVTLGRFCDVYNAVAFAGGNATVVNGYGSFAWGVNVDTHPRSDYAQAFGNSSYTYCMGQTAWSGTSPAGWTDGEGQGSRYGLFTETVTSTPTELTADSEAVDATNRLFIKPGRTYMCRMLVSARQIAGVAGTIGDSATWEIQAAIKRDLANNTVLVGAPTGTGTPLFSDAGAATWTVTVAADNTNESFAVTVTGEFQKTIRWAAHLFVSEVGSDT